jgi:hypothetical protein
MSQSEVNEFSVVRINYRRLLIRNEARFASRSRKKTATAHNFTWKEGKPRDEKETERERKKVKIALPRCELQRRMKTFAFRFLRAGLVLPTMRRRLPPLASREGKTFEFVNFIARFARHRARISFSSSSHKPNISLSGSIGSAQCNSTKSDCNNSCSLTPRMSTWIGINISLHVAASAAPTSTHCIVKVNRN